MYWWKTTMQVLSVMASLLVILILATVWMRLLCPAFPNEPVSVKIVPSEVAKEPAPVKDSSETKSPETVEEESTAEKAPEDEKAEGEQNQEPSDPYLEGIDGNPSGLDDTDNPWYY